MNNDYAVFETLRTYHGRIFELSAHLQRLRHGARILRIPVVLSDQQLTQALQAHCRGIGETRLKLMVTRDNITVESCPLRIDKKIYTAGVAVVTFPGVRIHPTVKMITRVVENQAYQFAVQHGYFDALLIDQQHNVPEAACDNIFYIKQGILYTPNKAILFGVTRKIVLQLAKQLLPIIFMTPKLEQLYQADELCITKSGTGIVPVVRINRKKIGTGKPGLVTKKLMQLFQYYVEKQNR